MTDNINIYEEDIFKFVFSIEDLEIEKFNFINENYKIFSESIEYLKKLYEFEQNDISGDEEFKLFSKINNLGKKIILFPQKIEFISSEHTLAAASTNVERKINTSTLVDKDSKYLIRVLSDNKSTKIYVFPTDQKPLNKYKLTLYPSQIELIGETSSNGIETEFIPSIDKIELELLEK